MVSWAPRELPSTRNCTPATPALSLALAVTVTVPETVPAGVLRDTAGAEVSTLLTVTVTGVEVAMLPLTSRARAVRTWVPLDRGMVFNVVE